MAAFGYLEQLVWVDSSIRTTAIGNNSGRPQLNRIRTPSEWLPRAPREFGNLQNPPQFVSWGPRSMDRGPQYQA
jgi:hypothetical protein